MKNCFVFPEMYTKVLSTGLPPATTFFHLYHPAVFTFIKPNAGLERDRRVTIFWHQRSYLCYQVKWKQNCKDERATDPAHSILTSEAFVKVSLWAFGGMRNANYLYILYSFISIFVPGREESQTTDFLQSSATYLQTRCIPQIRHIYYLEKLFFCKIYKLKIS